MAHMLFHEAGLMETFQIPQREFVNYFRALEANYGSNVCKWQSCIIIIWWIPTPLGPVSVWGDLISVIH